ncbi:MAG TPA: di-heme oxidoredictase family protein [Candidatus Binatia bacterium]|nr:di-heme oxidoredictase family protein [Candidatus Binatia bacterium]
MTLRRMTVSMRMLIAVVAMTATAGCDSSPATDSHASVPASWRQDCPPVSRPDPLGMDAAREAHRLAERRHELRLREAAAPGSFLRDVHAALDPQRLAAGEICAGELADVGQLLFEHEYGYDDGLGGGDPSRRAAGPFRRVHEGLFGGPETISCPSCHWIGGPNGAGAETDNAFLSGDGGMPSSGDARNPQALLALGVVQALAAEMTRELHAQRDGFLRQASDGTSREMRLVAKGVDFGILRAHDGKLDTSAVIGVDPDLVIKPFGWKGTLPDLESFSAEALQVHMGVQSDGLSALASGDVYGKGTDADDRDGDGRKGELGRAPFAAMSVHLALLEMPILEPLIQDRPLGASAQGLLPPTTTSFAVDFQRGRQHFHELGCAGCHKPMMVLESPVLTLEGLPPIDLSEQMRAPGLRYDSNLGGYPVWLFSDLKRHDMGKANTARHFQRGVAPEQYLTPRLWGVADSAPYLHDGRAPSFDYAIAGHDGEGRQARRKFARLSGEEKGALRVYLMSMRRESRVIVP